MSALTINDVRPLLCSISGHAGHGWWSNGAIMIRIDCCTRAAQKALAANAPGTIRELPTHLLTPPADLESLSKTSWLHENGVFGSTARLYVGEAAPSGSRLQVWIAEVYARAMRRTGLHGNGPESPVYALAGGKVVAILMPVRMPVGTSDAMSLVLGLTL